MKIRAKMRCMESTQHWNNRVSYRFMPVTGHGDGKAAEENKSFWEATPGGEANLSFVQHSKFWEEHGDGPGFPVPEYKPGDYFYVDMEPDEEGEWALSSKLDNGGHGNVEFTWWRKFGHTNEPGQRHSKLELHVDNERAFEGLGKPLARWKITFTFAEASDD